LGSDTLARTDQQHAATSRGKPLAWGLAIVFVLSMVMATGPGVLLVNRPETVLGIPLVYAWGIFWYLVQVAVALFAYFKLWRESTDEDTQTSSSPVKGDQR
jgi:hypothetical protein